MRNTFLRSTLVALTFIYFFSVRPLFAAATPSTATDLEVRLAAIEKHLTQIETSIQSILAKEDEILKEVIQTKQRASRA